MLPFLKRWVIVAWGKVSFHHSYRRGNGLGRTDLHLANTTMRIRIEVNERAALAMHDEVTSCLAVARDLDELVDRSCASPC